MPSLARLFVSMLRCTDAKSPVTLTHSSSRSSKYFSYAYSLLHCPSELSASLLMQLSNPAARSFDDSPSDDPPEFLGIFI